MPQWRATRSWSPTEGYATGGRNGSRVEVDKALNVRSVNGPQSTAIYGGVSPFVRCVYLANGASLSGFTLTYGFAYSGAGVLCESWGAVVSNCVITGNQASDGWSGNCAGGGAYGGTLNNCTLTRNSASGHTTSFPSQVVGGGAALCILNNCTLTDNSVSLSIGYSNIGAGPSEADGGGAALTRNSARASADDYFGSILPYSYGGGADDSALTNCTLTLNGAYYGGGAIGTLNNCTLTGNSAYSGGGALGTLNNCIVYFNSRDNYGSYSILNYCCTTPDPGGVGNITNAPLFVDTSGWANLRLQSNSPCINAGQNAFAPAGPDLDGNPRIAGDTVDIGAYEFQSPASMISYAWLQRFNLPIDPSTDTADPDGDGESNYGEWLAGSDPTNPLSFPPLLTLIPYGANVILRWPTNAPRQSSSAGRT